MQKRTLHLPALFMMFIFVFATPLSAARAAAKESEPSPLTAEDAIQLSPSEMDSSRGTSNSNSIVSTQSLGATTSGNVVSVGGNLNNGEISFNSSASTLGSYVMNTGNNSTINSAISLNVQITSP